MYSLHRHTSGVQTSLYRFGADPPPPTHTQYVSIPAAGVLRTGRLAAGLDVPVTYNGSRLLLAVTFPHFFRSLWIWKIS